jgi:streptogramin lyase
MAVVAVTAFAVARLLPDQGGVGTEPTPSPTATPTPVPSPTSFPPLPSPQATSFDGTAALVKRLGADIGPIDVVEALGSIWTANIHSNDVRRFDPTTLDQIVRIPAGTGPAWFAVTDDALWVTNQTGSGLVRIDPATNTVVAAVGDAQPCGPTVLAFGDLWASACDDNVTLRIDPSTNELLSVIPTPGYRWLALVDGRLITGSPATLAEIDPTTEALIDLNLCCGDIIGSDGQTIWLNRSTDVVRMDPADGTIVATFPYANAGFPTFVEGRAWLTVTGVGVIEIDLASNDVLRTIPIPGSQLLAREAVGSLWVTSFETSQLLRIEP